MCVCVCVSSITTAHLLQCTSHAAFVEYSLCVCLCVCVEWMIHGSITLSFREQTLSPGSESILPCVFVSYLNTLLVVLEV